MRRSPSAGASTPSPTVSLPISTEITGAQHERRAFHHFRVRTADDLSGCFPSNFWNRLVLQLGHSEPAIKHAVIAVATAHENYQAGSETVDGDAALDLQQYNKAIACLKQHLSVPTKHSTEVALICCALFICFEGLRGNYEAALIHLQSGIDIIKGWKTPGGNPPSSSRLPYLDPETDEDELIELFTRLDFSASAFVAERPPQMTPSSSNARSDKDLRNFSDARRSLERLVNRTIYFMIQAFGGQSQVPDTNPQPSPEQKLLLAALSAWSVQFDRLLKSPKMNNLSGRDLLGAFTLIMHKKTISVMLQTCHYQSHPEPQQSSIFSQFSDDMESIVTIAAYVASPSNNTTTSAHKPRMTQPRGQPKFTSDMGIIAPLHYVLVNCRDPGVREKAIGILAETKRREGIWDSRLIAEIAELQSSVHYGDELMDFEKEETYSRDGSLDMSSFLNMESYNLLEM